MDEVEKQPENNGELIIYQSENGTDINVRLDGNTVWLTQQQLANLFQTTKQNISLHINNIYEEGELQELGTVKDFLTVQKEGNRNVSRTLKYYNLDVIISVGYRVSSPIATRFRIWATARLKEYIIKGFTMDDERLKGNAGGNYWKELLERIRDIRSSEKVMYRQVLDLYAQSIDYDPNSQESIKFFKIVQNKLHYAAHGHTASEVIHNRIDAEKDFLGLTTFKGALPTKAEAKIAKNYLQQDELKRLNNIVSAYFDLAELQAERHQEMRMRDYVQHLDRILEANGDGVLQGSGTVSHEQAMQKVNEEYKKYQIKTITPVEQAYLDTIKSTQKKLGKKGKKNNE